MVAPFESLANEWRRIEILAAVSLAAKTGAPGATEELDEISQLTKQIKKLRRGPWKQIGCGALTDLQFDVLAAVVAPVVSHRVANLFANLEPRQPDGAATSGGGGGGSWRTCSNSKTRT